MADSYFNGKQLADLQDVKPEAAATSKPAFTKAKKDEVLKYVKWQNGCIGDQDQEYVGKGDKYICQKVGITQDQLDKFKVDRNEAIAALQPQEPTPEEV